MKYLYQMFEKEITYGNHVSYHFIYDYFDTISSPNSKLYVYENELKETVTNHFDLRGFQNALTTPNTTLKEDACFHVGMYKKFINDDVKNFFNIKVNFPIVYFTKKVKEATKKSTFKCGYSYDVFKNINHPLQNHTADILEIFKEETSQVIFASHFKENGDNNDNEINVEIIPHYSKEAFFSVKKKLLDNFDVKEEVLNLYDKKFSNYVKEDFHYHFKIKIKNNKTVVKFYRTFPLNPYVV